MNKLDSVKGNVAMTLEKLVGIRGDLVRIDSVRETWDFARLTTALCQWVKRNPVVPNIRERDENNRRKLLNARGEEIKRGCVYCGDTFVGNFTCGSLCRRQYYNIQRKYACNAL